MPARMILALMLATLVLPACQQDEPPLTTESARQNDAEDAVLSSLREKAEQGDASAQSNLGLMYTNGQGMPQDYIQAHMWYNLAAASGGDEDKERHAKNRDSIAEKMTLGQVLEAQRRAREWEPKSSGSQ